MLFDYFLAKKCTKVYHLFHLYRGTDKSKIVNPKSKIELFPLEAFDHHIHILLHKIKYGLDGIKLGFGVEI